MKLLSSLVIAVLAAITARGQGTINFANTATTLITTNDFQGHIGNVFGAGNYKFGLYVGPFGGAPSSFSLVSVATNSAFPGRFDGGSVLIPFAAGVNVSYQVRGWSSFAGNNFETAFIYASSNNLPIAYLGQSTLGFFTAPASGSIDIFGTGPGQIGGFPLTPPIVPEPSTFALGLVGLLTILACRGIRTRSRLD